MSRLRRVVKPEQHGTRTGYDYGCRCDACREARRKQGAEYRASHVEAERKRARLWAQTDRALNPHRYIAAAQRDARVHPERAVARHRVWSEIRSGRMARGRCEVCGAEYTHAHHDDYSRPLEVRWLCPVHHKEVHK